MIKEKAVTTKPVSLTLRDEAFGVVWDLVDWDFVSDIFRNIKMAHRNKNLQLKHKFIEQYENIITRNYNDQTVYDDNQKRNIESVSVSTTEDLVTQDGMAQMATLICNESKLFFDYAAAGAGTTPAQVTDLILEFETARVNINTSGYHSAGGGTTVKHAGIFAQGFMSADITEFGAFTEPDANAGVMLFRSVFPQSQALHHIAGSDFFTISHVIYLSSL